MNRFDYLEAATSSIGANHRAAAVRKELLGHILLKREELIEGGLGEDEAEAEALRSLGNPAEIAQGYGKPTGERHGARVYVATAVLAIAFAATLVNPLTGSMLWLAILAVLALASVSGNTVPEKVQAVLVLVRRQRSVGLGAAVSGVAVGLSTFGAPPPLWASFLWTVAVLATGLPALHQVWVRDRDGLDQEPWLMGGVGSAAFLLSSIVIYALGHWQTPSGAWIPGVGPVTIVGVPVMSLGLAGLGLIAGAWRQLQIRVGHTTSAMVPTEDDLEV